MFDYYAATIGDGICLPVLVASGYYFSKCNKRNQELLSKKEKVGEKIIFLATLVVGVLIQISWLVRDSIEINWTLPKVHTFNLAGWNHAVYFVGMLGVVVWLITKSILIYRKGKSLGKNSYVLMWAAGLGYLYTHIIDDYLNMNNFHYIILLVTVGVLVLFVLSGVKIKKGPKLKIEPQKMFLKDMIKLIVISIINDGRSIDFLCD